MKIVRTKENGYLLVEILVSLGIFAIIVVSTAGAILSIMDANSKSQAMKSVMDNLSVALENMSRSIRLGGDVRCTDGLGVPGSNTNQACSEGTPAISFLPQGATGESDRVYFYFQDINDIGTIFKGGISQTTALNAPEVDIDNARFYLIGGNTDDGQPRVVISVSGKSGKTATNETKFSVQTTVTLRIPDCDLSGLNPDNSVICPK